MPVKLKRQPKFYYETWLLRRVFRWIGGITLGHRVYFKHAKADIEAWRVEHERVHVWQVEKHGIVKFYLTYLFYLLRYGYRANPYEVEARKKSGEP